MDRFENLGFIVSLSVIILIASIILSLNYNHVDAVTQTGANASSTQPYTNDKIGVSLEHPADWKLLSLKNGFQLVKEKDKVYLEIRSNNLDSSNIQLGNYVNSDLKDRSSSREQFELLNKSQSTISGNIPAYEATYTFLKTKNQKDFSAEGKTDKILRIYAIAKDKVYTVAFVSEDDKYDLYLPTADKIIDSFKIAGLNRNVNSVSTEGSITNTVPNTENNTFAETGKEQAIHVSPINSTISKENKSLVKAAESGEESLNQTNAIGLSNTGYQTFENSTLGIKMTYPPNWKVQRFTDSVRFVAPKEGPNNKYIQTIDLFTYPPISLNQAVGNLTNYYNTSLTNFTIIGSPQASFGANSTSVSFMYSFNDETKGLVKSMDFIVSPQGSNKIYLFTFRDEDSKFQKDFPDMQKVIESIKFLK